MQEGKSIKQIIKDYVISKKKRKLYHSNDLSHRMFQVAVCQMIAHSAVGFTWPSYVELYF